MQNISNLTPKTASCLANKSVTLKCKSQIGPHKNMQEQNSPFTFNLLSGVPTVFSLNVTVWFQLMSRKNQQNAFYLFLFKHG